MIDLRRFDLNLLTAFEALMSERNVTRAAKRLGIGQPAMSHALSRLRKLVGDPLLIRTAGGMQPTSRALELAMSVTRILGDIRETVLADPAFQPEAQNRLFRVGTSDQIEVAVLPRVLTVLRKTAPRTRLAVSHVDRDRISPMLESGVIDLAIGYFPSPTGAEKHEVLFHEEFVCLFDAEACAVAPPISLEAYLALPHLLMSLGSEMTGAIDALLARDGHKRFVFMATPHFLAIPFLLHGFRAVAAVPRRYAEHCTTVAGLAISPLPVAVEGYDVSMVWHARTDRDPAQRWFREIVRTAKKD